MDTPLDLIDFAFVRDETGAGGPSCQLLVERDFGS